LTDYRSINALAESFFATRECELVARSRWRTREAARMAVFDFIEAFCNPRRRHSALGYLCPSEYERRHHPALSCPSVLPSARAG